MIPQQLVNLCLVFTLCLPAMAQQDAGISSRQSLQTRMQAFTTDYLSKALALDADQEAAFLPMFEAYQKQKRTLRRQIKQILEGALAKSDQEIGGDLQAILALQEQEFELEKAYLAKFSKVLTIRQQVALLKAREDIKQQFLRKQLKSRAGLRE